nr:bifunctional glutamate N-acetyltransferase/amino-acid acetyltransferase ArgJ [Bacillus cereus]
MIEIASITKVENGSIVTPKGFSAIGTTIGLKKEKKDLGAIVCDVPASCAAVYTTNQIQAAPLQVTKDSITTEGKLQAIIVNSGNANACTGMKGLQDAYEMRALGAEHFGLKEKYVGSFNRCNWCSAADGYNPKGNCNSLPAKEENGAHSFSEAILTTDLITKETCYEMIIDGKKVIAGVAKGSGMIHPNMATMLSFITTDARIEHDVLQTALSQITNHTFNQITVDGDTSTNDMVIAMASGLSETKPIDMEHADWETFVFALQKVCEDLAKKIAQDGEGATKLIEVNVLGVQTNEEAKKIAKQIVGSSLVKTAIHGEDPNWGELLAVLDKVK